jgi:hypothetical protein
MMDIPTAEDWVRFINDLIEIETRAFRMGLGETGHALNAAKQKAGYEREYQLSKAHRPPRGETK